MFQFEFPEIPVDGQLGDGTAGGAGGRGGGNEGNEEVGGGNTGNEVVVGNSEESTGNVNSIISNGISVVLCVTVPYLLSTIRACSARGIKISQVYDFYCY